MSSKTTIPLYLLCSSAHAKNSKKTEPSPPAPSPAECQKFFKKIRKAPVDDQLRLISSIPSGCSVKSSSDLRVALGKSLYFTEDQTLANRYLDLGVVPDSLALHGASWFGHDAFVDRLLSSTTNYTFDKDDKEALHYASARGYEYIVLKLISAGFTADLETFHYCCWNGLKRAVDQLLANGHVKPDQESLHQALAQGHEDIAMVLLNHGVKPDQESLHWAAFMGTPSLLKYMIEKSGLKVDDETLLNVEMNSEFNDHQLELLGKYSSGAVKSLEGLVKDEERESKCSAQQDFKHGVKCSASEAPVKK